MMGRTCYAIGGRINFNEKNISLCHGIDIGDKIIWRYDEGIDFTPQYYLDAVSKLDEANQSACPPCAGCSNLTEDGRKNNKLEVVTINTMRICQNRCVYCEAFYGDKVEKYDPLPVIKGFIEKDLVASHCLFDWGGGEPILGTYFEPVFLHLLKNEYMQRVNTNAVKLSEVLLNNLDESLVSLRISLDAGNRETYMKTMGRNWFDKVVDNIKRYREATENIVLKYVITNSNSDEKSIIDFINLAAEMDCKTICIDTEMYSYGQAEYRGLLRFTEKELKAAHLMKRLADERGMNVQIGYVWTAQDPSVPSRDFNSISRIKELNDSNETYVIPKNLQPIHKEKLKTYKGGIFPIVMPSLEALLLETQNKNIVLYGAGQNGKRLMEILNMRNANVTAVCDKYKAGQKLGTITIQAVEETINKMGNDSCMIITPQSAKDIVAELNEQGYEVLKDKIYYLPATRYYKGN